MNDEEELNKIIVEGYKKLYGDLGEMFPVISVEQI